MRKLKSRRLFVCQGPTPLLTLLSIIEQRNLDDDDGAHDDVLVITGLYAPVADEWEFARSIERLARSAHSFRRIVYLGHAEIEELSRRFEKGDRKNVSAHLFRQLGQDRFDEIYLSRTWLWPNRLIVESYPYAQRVGIGDGVGFHFSREYATPDGSSGKKFFEDSKCPVLPLHRGFFLLPDVLGEKADFPIQRVRVDVYLSTLAKLAATVPAESLVTDEVLLLTSNLSESHRMSLSSEVEAYVDYLESLELSPDSSILLKGHPRDRAEKLEKLVEKLATRYRAIDTVGREDRFLPIELLAYPRLREAERRLRIVTAGSTCLPLIYLFSRTADVGFGPSLVKKHFYADHVGGRCRFESDLRSATTSLRKQFGGVPQ